MLTVSEDNLIRWDELKLSSTGAFANAATVTWVLKNGAGSTVASGSLAYVASSNGRYQGTIESTANLAANTLYVLEVTAVQGSANGFRRLEFIAGYHGA